MAAPRKLRIAIVGGGIGGLTLAVALSKHGLQDSVEITIYDASSVLAQVGAGIALFPRGWEILKNMGLEEGLMAKLGPEQEKPTLDKERLYFSARKSNQAVGTHIVDIVLPGGSVSFHRADIQTILLDHLPSSIPCHLSHRLTSYVETEAGIELQFANGTTTFCDFLIGADGLNSAVRKSFLSEGKNWTEEEAVQNSRPLWTGIHIYRYVANAELIRRDSPNNRALSKIMLYAGKNRHIVAFPMRHGSLINMVLCVLNPGRQGTYYDDSSVIQASHDDVAHYFDGWEDDVKNLVKNVVEPSRWAIQYVKPLETYVSRSGRVLLLGDAAHATGPFFANGGGLAIEDAYFLSQIIAKAVKAGGAEIDVPKISQIYNRVRQPFCNTKAAGSLDLVRQYQFNEPGFEDYGDNVDIPEGKIPALAKLLTEGAAWTVTSAMPDVQQALKMW